MSNWALQRTGVAGDTTASVTVSSPSTVGAFGSWAELDAVVPAGVVGFMVHCPNTANGQRYYLKFAVGSAGSEFEITEPISHNLVSSAFTAASFYMPVRLPAGARFSVALASNAGAFRSIPIRVQYLFGSGLTPLAGCLVTTHGLDLANTRGTAVIASGTSGVFGTSVQVVAATPHRAIAASLGVLGNSNGVNIAGRARVFLGTSAIAACADIEVHSNSDIDYRGKLHHIDWVPCDIPAGSDLRIAFAHNGTATPQRGFFLHLLH